MKKGTLLRGRYRIDRPLGSGGCANVFAAFDQASGGEPVAVKVQRARTFELSQQLADDRERFAAEQENLQRLAGVQGIPRYRDHGDHEGSSFIVMDQFDGPALDDYILNPGVHSSEIAASIIAQLCEIVEEIHLRNMIHRDIKPENVILDEGGDVYLLDLGFTLPAGETPEKPHGTEGFCAPEQYHQGTPATVACDVFSLGCVLLYMVLRDLPYGGNARDADVGDAPFPPGTRVNIDPELYGLACEMVAVDPSCRPASVGEVRRRLEPCLPAAGSSYSPDMIGPDVTARYRRVRTRR